MFPDETVLLPGLPNLAGTSFAMTTAGWMVTPICGVDAAGGETPKKFGEVKDAVCYVRSTHRGAFSC